MPAATLQSLAEAVHDDSLKEVLGKGGKAQKNAFRATNRFVRRWGLRWNIKYDFYKHSADVSVPYLSPCRIISYLLERCPELLFGGVDDIKLARQHLSAFWSNYQHFHGSHEVFTEHKDYLDSVIPLLWHGDEGRGVRKGNTTICTIETPFGLDTYCRQGHKCCDCCPDVFLQELCSQQNTNLKHHSFLTKFVLFALPRKYYRETTLIHDLANVISGQLRSLFFEGVEINGKVWYAACAGLKGDLAWFHKLASLERSYMRLSTVIDREMCHECLAGSTHLPFEDISCYPVWRHSCYSSRPWTEVPASGLVRVPYDRQQPERILRRDVFHNTKMGTFQDLIAGAILLIAHFGYFDVPGEGNSRSKLLSRMHGHFRLWCAAVGKTPALMSFSKALFNVPTRKHYAWAKVKGSDSALLMQWLPVLCRGCINDLRDQDHLATLEGIHSAASAGMEWLTRMYKHGIWLAAPCAVALNDCGKKFLRSYNYLAWVALHRWDFPAFSMKPKIHMLCHEVYETTAMLDRGVTCLPNCMMWNCEMNEDVIGKVSRLSRRVHQSRVCERLLDLYTTKCHALHQKYRGKRPRDALPAEGPAKVSAATMWPCETCQVVGNGCCNFGFLEI